MLFVALALAVTALPAKWVHISTSDDATVTYIDMNSIIAVGDNSREAWFKDDYSKVKAKKERSAKTYWRFNCSTRQSAVLSATFYAPDGSVLSSDDAGENPEWRRVVPDSAGELMLNAVCGGAVSH